MPGSTHLDNPPASGLPSGADVGIAAALFQGRLGYTSSTSITLGPYNGEIVAIGRGTEYLNIGAGITCSTLANLITASGTDSTAPPAVPAVGTPVRYYAYISASTASFAPNQLRLSATAPTLDSNNVYYLTGANGLKWRYVGAVGIWNDGGGAGGASRFYDTVVIRGIANYYNRRPTALFSCPGYADDNAVTAYTINSLVWTGANGGTGSKIEFVANGEDGVHYIAHGGTLPLANTYPAIGVGEDTGATAACMALGSASAVYQSMTIGRHYLPAEGLRHLNLILSQGGAGNNAWQADYGRTFGDSVDCPDTCISATVML